MSKPQKTNRWLIKSSLLFIIIIAVTLIFAPRLINLEMVRNNIKDRISNDFGGQIKYRRLNLSYFPRPHVVAHKAEITLPDSFMIKIHKMKIYPKILPLFIGSLKTAFIKLEYADYYMELPQVSETTQTPTEILPFDEALKEITKAVRGLPEFKLPELNLKIKYGKVNLVDPFGRKFKLREVQASYHRSDGKRVFSIKCKSNLWDQIDINGSFDPSDFKGRGRIQLSRFRPQSLLAYLFPNSEMKVTNTRANISIDVESHGVGNIEAEVNGAIPDLELSHGKKKLVIKGSRVLGTVQVNGKVAKATLTELGLDYPKLNVTGSFLYDENQQDILLAINGSQIDADSVRQTALTLAGKFEIIRKIFDIIRGGHVPWMSVQIRGHKIAELGMLDNIVIKGRLTKGKIFIPGVKLDLNNVIGDAIISEGILQGENLQASLGNTNGQDGKLQLGLNKDIAPFELEIGVNADLSQLPPVLARVVKNKNFLNELALIRDVKGSATGILKLGDDLQSLNTKVEVSKAHLSASYMRIPYAIEIDGGHFVYDKSRIEFENFNANIGKSSLLQVSSSIDWAKTPSFKSKSKSAKFDIAELYSWLLSFETFGKRFKNVSSLNGNVSVQNLDVKGPFFNPQAWHFQSRGVVDKLILTSKKLNDPLHVATGQFSWQGNQFTFRDVAATLGASSANQVAGDVSWGKTPIFAARSGPASIFMKDINPLILSIKNVSKALKQFRPLDGKLEFESTAFSFPISTSTYQGLSFSADVKQIMIHSKRLPGPLRVDTGRFLWRQKRLDLKDIDASLGKSMIFGLSANFDTGNASLFKLHSKSVKLYANEIYPWLSSFENFQSAFFKDFSATGGFLELHGLDVAGPFHHPDQWHYLLTCKMHNLVMESMAFGEPVTVKNGGFEITSKTPTGVNLNRVNLETMSLIWGDNRLTLDGEMTLAKNDILLDMTIIADDIDWYQIMSILDYLKQRKAEPDRHIRKGNLLGTLKVQTGRLNYESLSVQDLQADISFKPEKAIIAIDQAAVCNIALRGLLKVSDQTLEIYIIPAAADQELALTFSCITDQKDVATGIYNLNGEILSKSKPDAYLRSLAGNVAFSSENGRIYRLGLLAKILSILNVTEIYRGEIPDLIGEGFAYRSMTVSADIKGGKLIMKECSIDGVSMGIACEGDIDLAEKKMDLIVLVAPFKTVDRIVGFIPVVGHILGGKLISIPFRAKGDLKDPVVIPLHPTAVGSGVLGILERTLKLPITIMQPLFSGGKNEKDDQTP